MQKHLERMLLMVAMLFAPWVVQGQWSDYSCDFDHDGDTAGWVFAGSGMDNQWYIGAAASNSGTNGLYVSNDGGTSNSYNASSLTFAYVYREVTLDAGSYVMTYDWRCNGESSYDYLRVFLAPSTYNPTPGMGPGGETSTYTWATAALPTGFISLSGANRLNLQSSWQNQFNDFIIATAGTYKLVFAWANDGSVGNNPAAAIDNVYLGQPTCPRPENLTHANVTAHSFDVSWVEAGTATEWMVELRNGSTLVSSGSVFDTSASFTALTANTEYTVRVASICGAGDTSTWRTLSVLTYCDAMDSLPYVMDFESVPSTSTSSPDFVSCWSRISNATDYFYPYVTSSASYNHTPGGNKGIYWYSTTGSSSYGNVNCIVLPDVDTSVYPINTLQLSFWARQSSSTNPMFQVGVLTDPTDISTFVPVDTVSFNNSAWSDFVVRFDGYTGEGTFVGIKAMVPNYWYAYMDDFRLEVAPDCPRVEAMTVSNLAPDSATVSWSERGSATSWEVSYLAAGLPNDSIVTMTVTDSSANLTALQPNTTYTVWVVPGCDSGEGGSNSTIFTTLCTDMDSLPYFYGFEDVSTTSQSATFGAGCWYRITDAMEYYYPYVGSSSYAHTGNRGLYWYDYYYSGGGYGSYQYVALPRFDSTEYPINSLQLRFWARSSSSSYYPTVQVGVITDLSNPSSFTPVATIDVGNSLQWHEFDVPLTGYTGAHGHVALYRMGSSSSSTMYLDDFILEVAPPCPRPDDLHLVTVTDGSMEIDWNDPDTNTTDWQLIYVPSGQEITSDSAVTEYPTSHPFTINDLEPGTSYDIYLYAECPDNEYSMARMISAQTACTPIDTLPYRYGFEGTVASSSGTIDVCWNKGAINSSSNYPYPSSTSYEGTRSLYFYGYYYNNEKCYAVMPMFSDSIDDLQVSFKLRAGSMASYYCNELTVGLMSNPYDINTFTPITRCEATSNSTWDSFTVLLYGHQSEGRYIAFVGQGRNSSQYYNYVYLDDVVVDHAPNCGPVTNLAVVPSVSSAMVSWTPSVLGESQGAIVEYREAADSTSDWTMLTPSESFVALTSLNPTTTYAVRVYNSCVDGNSVAYVETMFTTSGYSCLPDTTLATHDTIGTGTGTNYYIPSYSYYGNAISQQVYLDRELSGIGKITSMKLHSSEASSMVRQWDIYLANVSDSSAANWILPLQKTLVWSGPVSYVSNGWVEFEFTTPFDRIPGSNLLVMVSDHTGSYVSSPYNTAYTHTLPDGRMSRYVYQDGTAYNPDGPTSSWTGSGSNTLAVRCNMVFDGYPCTSEMSTCAAPPVIVTDYNPNGATIDWAPGSGEASWDLYYKEASDATWTSVGEVFTNSYTFTTLSPGTAYQAMVVNNCTGESLYSVVDFFVPCPKIDSLPFFENFDSYGTGTGIHAPTCWNYGSGYDDTYPYIISTNHGSGTGGSMYMYNSTYYDPDSYTYFVLPELDSAVAQVTDVQAVFYGYDSYNGYTHQVIVGVMSDPGNIGTFVPVDTIITQTSVWNLYEVPLNNYTGTGRHIAFASHPGPGSTYCYPYIDDLWIERIPSCQRPDSLQASNITANSVDLQWNSRSDASEFVIEYGPFGFTPGTGTAIIVSTNPYTLSGLPASYQGEYYVRNICDGGDTSDYSRFPCRFTLNQVPATVPYHYNFEDSTEWANWQVNSNCNINWYRGTTVPAYDSSYSMYISPDGGITFGTDMNAIVNAAAYRDIDFGTTSNSYDLTFRYKCGGTTTARYDGLMVFLVDPNAPVEASNTGIVSPWGNVNNLYRIANLRLDTAWTLCHSIFDTVSGVRRMAFFWFNQSTGTGSFEFGPAAVDDINISLSPCPRPVNLAVNESSITASSAQLTWDGPTYMTYRVAYRQANASASANQYVTTSTNSVTLTGLDPMTSYNVWVQKICGSDSSLFSDGTNFVTALCDDAVYAYDYDATMTTTSSSYGPIGYATYNYSYVQTLIDSAHMAGMTGPITAFAFNALSTTSSDYYTGMDVYMANVSEGDLASGFIMPDANHEFVQVISNGNFNFTDIGWHTHGFDTTFTWDGHSNVLFAVNRHHGSWSSSTSFSAHSTSSIRTRYIYQDSGPYNPATVSGGYTYSYVGDIQFISCGAIPVCPVPEITGITQTYNDATVTWTGDGTDYEVNIKESAATNWPATDIHVSGTSHTFTGLMPATEYTVRVRQDCTLDSIGFSEWTLSSFTTDSLPCFTPDSLTVTAVTNATATLDWVPMSSESSWQLHVWYSGGLDSVYTVTSHPATVGGLSAGITYNASVRPLCGSDQDVIGDWGDTVTFTTAICPDVTGLGTRDVTANSVEVYWTADPMATSWILEYGFHGFDAGTGTTIPCSNPVYVVNGLMDEMEYDFRVRAVCGPDWNSEGWAVTSATTQSGGIICNAPTNVSAVVAGNSATISWTPSEGNIRFELQYGTRGFAIGSGTTVSANASPVTLTDLDYETSYDVYVMAYCAENTPSAWSTVASFTTEPQGSQDCDPVSDLTASNVTENSALLTWTPGTTGDEWEVVLTDASGATVSEASTTEHQYALSGLTPGTAYVAKVRTVCGDGVYSTFVSTSFTTVSVGIDRVAEAGCTIYPNPTSGATTIRITGITGKVKISVVDMNGREVVVATNGSNGTLGGETLECSGDCAKSLDVERLAQGAYFVRITGENVSMVRKLIVR